MAESDDGADSVETLTDRLKTAGVSDATVEQFQALLTKCNVCTLGSLRLFAPKLEMLLKQMFNFEDELQNLQAMGFCLQK